MRGVTDFQIRVFFAIDGNVGENADAESFPLGTTMARCHR